MESALALNRQTLHALLHDLSELLTDRKFKVLCIIEPEENFTPIPAHPLIQSVLCVKFDDVEPSDNCLVPASTRQLDLLAAYLHTVEDVPLLVACNAGISRSVAVVAAYEVYKKVHTKKQALTKYNTLPYCINTWLFEEVLSRLEKDYAQS